MSAIQDPRPAAPSSVAPSPADDRLLRVARRAAEVARWSAADPDADRRWAAAHGEFVRRFEDGLVVPLRAWCEQRADRVAACYLPPPNPHLEAFVVGAGERYDFDLSDALVQFERQLYAHGWRVHTMYIPRLEDDRGLRDFFDFDGALEVYGDRRPTPPQG